MKFVLPKVSATGAHQLSRLFVLLALLVGGLSSLSCATLAAERQITKEVRHSRDGDIAFWNTVKQVDVIYVGETHDDPADHEYQIQLIRGLLARKLGFAVGWEMFDWTQQALLDDWHRRRISLDGLLRRTDFQKSWGLYSTAYSKILKITGQNRIRNIALNAPAGLPRKIAHGENLTREEQQMMPEGFVATEGAYKNFVSMIGDHPGMQRNDLRRSRPLLSHLSLIPSVAGDHKSFPMVPQRSRCIRFPRGDGNRRNLPARIFPRRGSQRGVFG